jgi:pyruvate kinase
VTAIPKSILETRRRTKIVATLGPACDDYSILLEMVKAGLDVARLNMSHGEIEGHYARIERIRQASAETGRCVSIMADLCGPKIRIGHFEEDQVLLSPGDRFTLTTEDIVGTASRVSCQYKNLPNDVTPGETIYLSDGLIEMKVKEVEGSEVHCEVLTPGILTSGKGLNLPGTHLSTPSLTEKDKVDLQAILKAEVDYVALSFVRGPKDVSELKERIELHGASARVVAKIEKPEAVNTLSEILEETDAIMVARGDLGVETSVEAMPILQKQILFEANRRGIPAITATQMLESMIANPHPTRAEASDVANAILDGTDAIMLSGETAAGNYPVRAVQTMARIAEVTEPQIDRWRDRRAIETTTSQVRDALGQAATQAASRAGARAICAFTRSGSSAFAISKCRPDVPILALTPEEAVMRRINLAWGVYPFKSSVVTDAEEMLAAVNTTLLEKAGLRSGDLVCLVSGMPVGVSGQTNTLHLMRLK